MRLAILLVCFALTSRMSGAQNWESCDRWAGTTYGDYEVWNNGWGGSFNEQCIYANGFDDWWVWTNHPTEDGGIKSYPHVKQVVSYFVDDMPSITSSFNVSRPGSGSYNTAYDIWYDNYAYEIMLWVNWSGGMGPIAYNYGCGGYPATACPAATNVNVGGHTWDVFQGNNGHNIVYSFLRTSNTNSGTVDITAISQWLRNNGWFANAHLHDIQLGWEITQANGTNFYMNDFDISIGGGGCNPSSITPYAQVNGGSWSQSTNLTVASGATVKFGPQPFDGTWSWSGCGTSGSSREQTIYPTSSCLATATFTNSCGAQSTVTYNITVEGSGGGGGSTYRLQNRGTGLYLDGYGLTTNGSTCAQYANTTHPNAQWEFVDVGSGYTQLRNVGTGLYLDGMGRSNNGADVGQWAGTTHHNSHWSVQAYDGSWYRLQNRTTGLYLDGMGRTSNGSAVGQWGNTTHPNAQWQLVSVSGSRLSENEPTVADEIAAEMIKVYPNPAHHGHFKVDLSKQLADALLTIYDGMGRIVYVQQLIGDGLFEIQSDLRPGVYMVSLSKGSIRQIDRLVAR